MPEPIRKVGQIGLGRMGSGIAQNILKAGFDLSVYNRTPGKIEPLVKAGASAARSPREAASEADVVVTCLLDDQSVLGMAVGEDGLLAGLKPGGIHIGTTTVSPAHAAQMAELHAARGSHYVAGPVVGRPHMAAAGDLWTYVAGDPEVIARCTPVLQAYTRDIAHLGTEHRRANSVKLAINFLVIAQVEMIAEAYAFAEKSGIDLEFMNGLVETFVGSAGARKYAEVMRKRDFDNAGFELSSGFKDVRLMLEASTEVRAPLEIASVLREKYLTALAHGMERRDWSAVYEISRMHAGLV